MTINTEHQDNQHQDNQNEREPLNGSALLDQVVAALRRYVILPDDHALVAVAMWIAATHALPAWNTAPRLVIRAPEKRCGKSRLVDIIEGLCHQPLLTVNASPSAVYRAIGDQDTDPPTLLLDEADTVFGPAAGESEDLRGLLNAGHQRNRPAIRYDAGTRRIEKIETFAMAALAGIGRMPDTIEDRAIIVHMRRRAPGETVAPYRVHRDGPALHALRTRLHQWIRAHLDHLETAAPDMPVEDRAADTWEPLTAIADLAAGPWPELVRQAALAQYDTTEHDTSNTSLRIRLLTELRDIFTHTGAEALQTSHILHVLRNNDEAPWQGLGPSGLTAMRMGQLLRDFGITSRTMRFNGDQAKGFQRLDFEDAWARYCPQPVSPPYQPYQPSHNTETPSQPSIIPGTASNPGTAQAVPPNQAVPPPNAHDKHKHHKGTTGTAGTATPHKTATCIICRTPMTPINGHHTHPGCEQENPA